MGHYPSMCGTTPASGMCVNPFSDCTNIVRDSPLALSVVYPYYSHVLSSRIAHGTLVKLDRSCRRSRLNKTPGTAVRYRTSMCGTPRQRGIRGNAFSVILTFSGTNLFDLERNQIWRRSRVQYSRGRFVGHRTNTCGIAHKKGKLDYAGNV